MSDVPDNDEQIFYAKKRQMRRKLKLLKERQETFTEERKVKLTPLPRIKHKKKLYEVNDDDES